MTKIYRCKCKNMYNNKICKNKFTNPCNIFNNTLMCLFHYKYYSENYALIIQKYYKGYKIRKKIKNIYIKLPDDLQEKISYIINREHYYKKYKKLVAKLVINKIVNLCNILQCKMILLDLTRENSVNSFYDYFIKNRYNIIYSTFDLYTKYYEVIKYSENLHSILNIVLRKYRNILDNLSNTNREVFLLMRSIYKDINFKLLHY